MLLFQATTIIVCVHREKSTFSWRRVSVLVLWLWAVSPSVNVNGLGLAVQYASVKPLDALMILGSPPQNASKTKISTRDRHDCCAQLTRSRIEDRIWTIARPRLTIRSLRSVLDRKKKGNNEITFTIPACCCKKCRLGILT